ncbi:MAG: glutamate formimidoyltransferase [Armatimonadota bacterium]
MKQIIQCVPNFSEGRNQNIIKKIVDAAQTASSVKVIDYSFDVDHNRLVVTLLGDIDEIYASVIGAVSAAVNSIDLRCHEGAHPRIGAVDVTPLVPISGIEMQECVALSRRIGERIAARFSVPVYYYENSAINESHLKLPVIRKGGFEHLVGYKLLGDRKPDSGPSYVHPSAGAAVIGARGPLIAYNINLATDDINTARTIVKQIRANSSLFPGLKVLSVNLKSRKLSQISTNITQPDLLPISHIFDFVRNEANLLGVEIAESEFIGAISEKYLSNISVSDLLAHNFMSSQIIENWI